MQTSTFVTDTLFLREASQSCLGGPVRSHEGLAALHRESELLAHSPHRTAISGEAGPGHSVLITSAPPECDSFWQALTSLYVFLESMMKEPFEI